jgi:hypothetical protein
MTTTITWRRRDVLVRIDVTVIPESVEGILSTSHLDVFQSLHL